MENKMKIGIMALSIGDFGQKGFYNMQEIGHAKALSKLCDFVEVYKLADEHQQYAVETIDGYENTKVYVLPSKRIGSNGMPNMSLVNPALDALFLCADTQLAVPLIERWARKNNVKFLPYIGVIESHSTNQIKKFVMSLLFQRNLAVYKKHHCIAKTPKVKEDLQHLGVKQITVAPVGLDVSLLNSKYSQSDITPLKQKYGYAAEDKILLFIGRLTEEKQPLRMIDIFSRAYNRDPHYKLLMVGTGELKAQVATVAEARGIVSQVKMIDRIPNKDIWELYRIADCFVNLNQQEIFGMAILEAMYYGCKVVAWQAPGPSFIIEDGISGCLADSDDEILNGICERSIQPQDASQRILNHFTWENTAKKIISIIESDR